MSWFFPRHRHPAGFRMVTRRMIGGRRRDPGLPLEGIAAGLAWPLMRLALPRRSNAATPIDGASNPANIDCLARHTP